MKALFRNLGYGFTGYGKSIELLFGTRLAWFLLVPIGLFVVTFILNGILGQYFSGSLSDYFIDIIGIEEWAFWGSSYLGPFLEGLVQFVLRVVFFLFMAYMSGVVTLILLSPFLAVLSEKTEQIITGADSYPFDIVQVTQDALRGAGIVIRNMFIQTLYAILFFFLAFVPFIGALVSFFGMFLVASYFYGFSFMDYTNERRKLKLKDSVAMIRKHKSLAILLGSGYWLTLTIPFIGSLFGGVVALFATVAATVAMFETPEYAGYKKSNQPRFENPPNIGVKKADQ